jgi:hypothetical protein
MPSSKLKNSMLVDIAGSKLIGAMPAIDGSALTGVSGFMKSASDPATDTNPSGGVGSGWVNTSDGEIFICTDATTDANVWFNVGGGIGDVQPWIYQGTQYGYTSGSGDPTAAPAGTAIEKHSYTSDGNATDHADLAATRASNAGHSSATHGYVSGGGGANHFIEKFVFSSGANSVNTGFQLSTGDVSRNGIGTTSTETHGYCAGGTSTNVIDRFSYSTDGTATDVGDLLNAQVYNAGASSKTHGYNMGGLVSSDINVIQKFAFGSSANATDVGDLTTICNGPTGHQSSTHGYKAGGSGNGTYATGADSIQKFTFASDANSTNVGTTTVGRFQHASGSSTTHGYASGGLSGGSGNVIEKFLFASDSNATDVGDLVISRSYLCGQQY